MGKYIEFLVFVFLRFCTVFKIFHVRLGKKGKMLDFTGVYVCVKAKLTFVRFFSFFFLHLSLITNIEKSHGKNMQSVEFDHR